MDSSSGRYGRVRTGMSEPRIAARSHGAGSAFDGAVAQVEVAGRAFAAVVAAVGIGVGSAMGKELAVVDSISILAVV